MSHDVLLRNLCLHELAFVQLELDISTMRDIRLPYPIGNRRGFILHANRFDVREGDSGQFAFILEVDELAPQDGFFKVHFLKSIRGSGTFFFEATWTTIEGSCPRCQGTGVENDPRSDGVGNFQEVVAEQKLKQEVERFETVENQSMKFHPELGTNLNSLIGTKQLSNISLQGGQLQLSVRRALEHLQRLQRIQRRYQELDAGEWLNQIIGVSAAQDPVDPTSWLITTRLSALSGRTVETRALVVGDDFRSRMPPVTDVRAL